MSHLHTLHPAWIDALLQLACLASGPGAWSPRALGSVRAIDVHPTIARWIGIQPGRPVDGAPIEALFTPQPGLRDR